MTNGGEIAPGAPGFDQEEGGQEKYAFENSETIMAAMKGYYIGREGEESKEDFDRVIRMKLAEFEEEFGEHEGNNSRALSKLQKWYDEQIRKLPPKEQEELARKLKENREKTMRQMEAMRASDPKPYERGTRG